MPYCDSPEPYVMHVNLDSPEPYVRKNASLGNLRAQVVAARPEAPAAAWVAGFGCRVKGFTGLSLRVFAVRVEVWGVYRG